MTETAGAVENGFVLRVSVPASGELGALGPALGVKLAEQLGVAPARAAGVGEAMADLARQIAPAEGSEISYDFHKDGAALRIAASQGTASRTTTVSLTA